ncbi:unnamed protein product [Brassicogethes aeneus]|uniref:C2H2-type domain-containing protein n=1 Tax=Brassicogethes aeneus TaxID=1431903 RepID=A0A9P0BHH3_BRAAE|nr:unnamed protein product [Brassicogethes aeneus]
MLVYFNFYKTVTISGFGYNILIYYVMDTKSLNNLMEENKVQLLDELDTKENINLIHSKDVEKENPSLLDSLITFGRVQNSVEPKNFEGNNNEKCRHYCKVESKINDCVEEKHESDPGDETKKILCNIKEEKMDSDFEDEKYSPYNEAIFETKFLMDYHKVKYEDEDDLGSKINESVEERDKPDLVDESEKLLCNIKEEIKEDIMDSDFSEDEKNYLHNEVILETKTEVDYHKVKTDDEDESGEALKGDDDKNRCPHCQKQYTARHNLKQHIESQHGDLTDRKKYTCPHCEKIFSHLGTKNDHIRSKHEGFKINCPHCPKTFTTKCGLRQHLKTLNHDSPQKKEYQCAQCERNFTEKDLLTQHVKLKHKGFKYTCPHCPKTYSTRSILQQHVQSQHGDPVQRKKYECAQCDKTFASVGYLNTHIKSTHEGFKFPCPHCPKMYTERRGLYGHLQIKHAALKKEYKCPLCDEKFSTRKSRLAHIDEVHDGHRYKCEHCQKTYIHSGNFNKHVRNHHSDTL